MEIRIRHLRQFITVADELHFTRASDLLFIAQPALSASIRKLETELGLVLFARNTRSVELTPEGQAFLPEAREAVASYDRAMRAASRLHGEIGGRVSLGLHAAVGSGIRQDIVSRLRAAAPGVTLTIVAANTGSLMEDVRTGRIDAALRLAQTGIGELATRIVAHQPLAVVLPHGHPLAARRTVKLTDLRSEDWILPGDQVAPEDDFLLRLCKAEGFETRRSPAISDFDDGFANVAEGRGIVVLPEGLVAARALESLSVVRISGADAPICFVTKSTEVSAAVDAAYEAVRAVFTAQRATLPPAEE